MSACKPLAGYFGDAGQEATPCPANEYCAAGSAAGIACPLGTVSSTLSTHISDCTPTGGYYGKADSESGVQNCPTGSYCPAGVATPTRSAVTPLLLFLSPSLPRNLPLSISPLFLSIAPSLPPSLSLSFPIPPSLPPLPCPPLILPSATASASPLPLPSLSYSLPALLPPCLPCPAGVSRRLHGRPPPLFLW